MLSTNVPPVTCTRCGWQNELTARMCGGCGMPLRTTDPGATSNADLVGGWASPALSATPASAEMAYPPDAPTAYAPQFDQSQQPTYALAAPGITAPPRQQAARPVIWGGPAVADQSDKRARGRVRGPWWRVPLIALVVLGVLAGGGLGAWAIIIRPSVHAQVDGTMRASLNTAIEQVDTHINQIPMGKTLQVTVSASEMDRQIGQNIPAGSPITDVHLHLASGSIQITYTLNGSAGAITTHLQTIRGRLEARATSVDFPLGFVESGDEMESAINDAFARLPTSLTVLEVDATNDALTLKVRT